MARVRVKLKLDRLMELTHDSALSGMLLRKAQAVYAVATARAPVATGNYRRRFRVTLVETDRTVARIYNDAEYAHRLEYGDSATPKHRTLGNALDAAGGG